jgi:hypothetical protein
MAASGRVSNGSMKSNWRFLDNGATAPIRSARRFFCAPGLRNKSSSSAPDSWIASAWSKTARPASVKTMDLPRRSNRHSPSHSSNSANCSLNAEAETLRTRAARVTPPSRAIARNLNK